MHFSDKFPHVFLKEMTIYKAHNFLFDKHFYPAKLASKSVNVARKSKKHNHMFIWNKFYDNC